MLKILPITALVLTLSVSLSSCHSGGSDGYLIEFETKPVDDQHPLASVAPSRAILKYKGDRFLFEMTAMNVFNTTFLYNPKHHLFAQTVSFMDMQRVCVESEDDIRKDYEDYQLNLEETNDTLTIAGYLCKRVKATLASDPKDQFDVYYAPELKASSANEMNPYKGIKGLLLQYRIKRMGLEMNFKAISITKTDIPDNAFEIPADYKKISRKEMDKIFAEIQ